MTNSTIVKATLILSTLNTQQLAIAVGRPLRNGSTAEDLDVKDIKRFAKRIRRQAKEEAKAVKAYNKFKGVK